MQNLHFLGTVDGELHLLRGAQPLRVYAALHATGSQPVAPNHPNTPNTCLLYTSPSPRD